MVWRALCTLLSWSDKCWSSRQGRGRGQTKTIEADLSRRLRRKKCLRCHRTPEPQGISATWLQSNLRMGAAGKLGCIVKSSQDVTAMGQRGLALQKVSEMAERSRAALHLLGFLYLLLIKQGWWGSCDKLRQLMNCDSYVSLLHVCQTLIASLFAQFAMDPLAHIPRI